MLRSACRRFTEREMSLPRVREVAALANRFDPATWVGAVRLGLPSMLVDGGITAAAIVAEELGRMLHPGPFVGTNVVVDALARAGADPRRAEALARIVSGAALVAWAWTGAGDVVARPDVSGWQLNGRARAVPDAVVADHLLVSATSERGPLHLLVPTRTPGVTIDPLDGLDLTRRFADVAFDAVDVGHDTLLGAPGDDELADRLLQVAATLTAADAVGATARLFELAVDYAKDRVAFGRPIGGFQAIKHSLADGLTSLEASQAALWQAVASLEAGKPDAAEAVSAAKAFVGRRCPAIVQTCMQVHGGVAMTWEHDSHLYLRRVRTDDALYGSWRWHQDRLCTLAGMGAPA